MGAPLNSADARSVAGYRRRLDPALFRFRKRWRYHSAELCQAIVPGTDRCSRSGCKPGVTAIFRETLWRKETDGVRADRKRFHLSDRGSVVAGLQHYGRGFAPAD